MVEKSDHNIVLTAMIGMFMRNRERGSNNSCKFMILTQRWFKKEDYGFIKTEKQKDAVLLKRESVVTFKNQRGNFLVYKIWKENCRKLFPCPDDLEWPIVDKILNGKSHRIGLKRIVLLGDTFKYLEYKNQVQDGVNVRKTYIMECDIQQITALLGKVGI